MDQQRLAEGKTKIIYDIGGGAVRIVSKDDITAGDGARHDVIPGKGALSNQTTSNVFALLKDFGVPVAFMWRNGISDFLAYRCTMLPFEVVVRRLALGSYLKQHPDVLRGSTLPELPVEFYLKTSGRHIGNIQLPKDDPLVTRISRDSIEVVRPDVPLAEAEPVAVPTSLVYDGSIEELFRHKRAIEYLARMTFKFLEAAWAAQDFTLCDCKVEFGVDAQKRLRLADVIDNDSWRLLDEYGNHLDKQRYRDGAPLDEVAGLYRKVANRTSRFEDWHETVKHKAIAL